MSDPFPWGGIVSAAGSIIGAGINAASVAGTNAANIQLTHEAWARDDNAMQRRVKDMEAAGLNPMLATGQAAGNTSPIPQRAFEGMPNVGEAYNQGVVAQAEAASRRQGIVQSQAQIDLINAQRDKVASEKAGQDLSNLYSAKTIDARTKTTEAQSIIAGKDAEAAVATLGYRIQNERAKAGLTDAQWDIATQDAVTAMNRALASGEMAQLGIDAAKAQIALDRVRQSAAFKSMDKTDADIAAMAFAIQASGMNADALKKMGIAPMYIDLLMNLATTAAKAATSRR